MRATQKYLASRFRPSLRVTIGVPFALLYSATVSVLTLLPYLEIRELTRTENLRLLEAINQDALSQLRSYLGGPFQLQRKLASDIAQQQLYTARNAVALQRFLLRSATELTEAQSHIAMLGFGRPDGTVVGFRRNLDKPGFSLVRSDLQHPELLNFYPGDQVGPVLVHTEPYSALRRSWYTHAEASPGSVWTPIDASAGDRSRMSLYASTALHSAAATAGVFTVHLALDSLHRLLASQPLKGHGVIFITDHAGFLVADSEPLPPLPETTTRPERVRAADSPSALIRRAADQLQRPLAPASRHFTLEIDDALYFGRVTPFHDPYGLHWQIFTLLPESDLLGNVLHSTRTILLWIAGFSSLLLLLGLLLIQHITRPLHRVAVAAHALARGEMGTRIDSHSNIQETHALVSAFNTMSGNLQTAFRDLREQLSRDHLTKLLSRQGLLDQSAAQVPGYAVLCFVGLNEFRNINDIAGYRTGDLLIQRITQRLRERLPSRALIARIDSDELAVLFPHIAEHDVTRDYALLVQEPFRTPLTFGANEIRVSASIGYVSGYLDSGRLEDWMRHASMALHATRRRGFSQCVEFSADMMEQSVARTRTAIELRLALEREELFLCYQPIVRLRDQTIVAVEARPCWNHPTRGVLGAEHFLPIAHDSDLILRLEHWIMQRATRQFAAWLPTLSEGLRLHLNISNQQVIQSAFVNHLQHLLIDSGLPGHRLSIEVTDTRLVEKDPGLKRRLRMLRGLGVQLALTDFGAGNTSLAHLSQMPFECFKINKRLIADLLQSKKAAAVVMAILNIGHHFDTRVIADGVSSAAQARRLTELGCEYAQGDYFGAARTAGVGSTYADAVRVSSC